MATVTLSFPDLILLSLTITTAMVAVRLLWNLASKKHKRAYGRPVQYVFLIGTVAGFALPWDEPLGLVGAFISSLSYLFWPLPIPCWAGGPSYPHHWLWPGYQGRR